MEPTQPAPPTSNISVRRGEPLVVVDHVDKHFGDLHVLNDINTVVNRGEVVVVIGPSGSGKSTLCRAINRLETIDSGTIIDRRREAPRGGRRAREAACRRRHGLPVVQPVRAQDRARERHPRTDPGEEAVAEGGRGQGDGAPRPRRRREPGEEDAGAALGRPAAARRDRPVARDEPEAHPHGRADERARPRDDQRGARRHDRPREGRHDDDRRHPRDGLRPQGGRPRAVHGRRAASSRRRRPREFFDHPESDRAKDFLSKILEH